MNITAQELESIFSANRRRHYKRDKQPHGVDWDQVHTDLWNIKGRGFNTTLLVEMLDYMPDRQFTSNLTNDDVKEMMITALSAHGVHIDK